MRDLKSIEFYFENCEYFDIDAKYFGEFYIGDIRREISRIACNAISDMDVAYEFKAEIYREGNGTYNFCGAEKNKFERLLAYNDITSITLKYDKGPDSELYLDYKEAPEEEGMLGADNVNQSSKLSSLGNLYIAVHSYKTVDSEFPSDVVEDEDKIIFEKIMLGIADNYSRIPIDQDERQEIE